MMAPFIVPPHSPYPWYNEPRTDSAVDATHLMAAENDLIGYTQTAVNAYDSFAQGQFIHQDDGSVVTVSSAPRISILWEPYNADNTGNTDVTSTLNSGAAAAAIDLAPGTYLLNGLLDVPADKDFLGVGTALVKLKLGANGGIRTGNGGGANGGVIGGFEVDGNGAANLAGGGFHVAGRNSVTYRDMYIHGCLTSGMLIDGGQNNNFDNIQWGTPGGTEVSLVFDHSVGGLNFYGCEIAAGLRVQQTHTDFSGGYGTWVGPSDIHFHGGRTEYPVSGKPLVYLAAGGNISLNSFGVAGSGSLIVMEQGATNYPLKTTSISAWDAGANITVADAAGVTALMSANVPNCPPETIVNGVTGSGPYVVTLSIVPTADPTGGTAKFGARMLDFTVFGPNGVSGDGTSTAFDMRGGTTLTLSARPTIQNHLNAYLARHSDLIYVAGATPKYSSVTNTAVQQQVGDTGSVATVLNAAIINPVLGVLDLTSSGAADASTVSVTGDKIALSGGTYGFGIQSGRLVAYTPASSAGFAVRAQHSGVKSSGTDAIYLSSDGHGVFTGHIYVPKVTLTYSASITPNAQSGPWQTITVTNATAFTINAPTNPPTSSQNLELTIEVLNSSGGAMGAITWNTAFVFAGQTWTNPANTKKRFARFEWNGANWICTSLSTADY